MQIRAGNRQDEPLIRTIVFQAMEELSKDHDLEGRDRDLRNIEQNYFWFDGLCLVAEEDGQVVGVVAAKRRDSEDILLLSRLAVAASARKQGVARKLLSTVQFFAANMDYKTIRIEAVEPSCDLLLVDRKIMHKLGFKESAFGLDLSSQNYS